MPCSVAVGYHPEDEGCKVLRNILILPQHVRPRLEEGQFPIHQHGLFAAEEWGIGASDTHASYSELNTRHFRNSSLQTKTLKNKLTLKNSVPTGKCDYTKRLAD
jgi:hypothetical protein